MRHTYLLLLLTLIACAHERSGSRAIYIRNNRTPSLRSSRSVSNVPGTMKQRLRIAQAAASVVGQPFVKVNNRAYRADCSGTVRGIYALAGFPLEGKPRQRFENDTSILHRYVFYHGSLHDYPALPGDLIFFHDTFDPGGAKDGELRLTHVGVVEKILVDGTIIYVHHLKDRIIRGEINLMKPSSAEGNAFLRRADADRPSLQSAQLFAGFGTLALN